MGRKPKPSKVPNETIVDLLAIGCNMRELEIVTGLSEDTLMRRFSDVIEEGRAQFRVGLRRMQYATAKSGNVGMQIWLGKQYLDQSEPQHRVELTGKDGAPIEYFKAEKMTTPQLEASVIETAERIAKQAAKG